MKDRETNLSKVTQLISGRAGNEPRPSGPRGSAQSHEAMLQKTFNNSKESPIALLSKKVLEKHVKNYNFYSFYNKKDWEHLGTKLSSKTAFTLFLHKF